MMCERCKVKLATLHVVSMQNNEKIENYLCEECASEIESSYYSQSPFDDFFKSLLNMQSMITPMSSQPAEKPGKGKRSQTIETACPMCNMTLRDFKKTGKLGCGVCFTTFGDHINLLVKRIHGNTRHGGKIPTKAGKLIRKKHEIDYLRQQLKKAVEIEAFEEAAELRDKIRALEGINKGGQSHGK